MSHTHCQEGHNLVVVLHRVHALLVAKSIIQLEGAALCAIRDGLRIRAEAVLIPARAVVRDRVPAFGRTLALLEGEALVIIRSPENSSKAAVRQDSRNQVEENDCDCRSEAVAVRRMGRDMMPSRCGTFALTRRTGKG